MTKQLKEEDDENLGLGLARTKAHPPQKKKRNKIKKKKRGRIEGKSLIYYSPTSRIERDA